MAEENLYKWTDNPTVSGVAKCDTDVLNDCLMHLKYENENPNILKTNQITNCLLEVPQRIKLELADGVLTLKAGSEVIIPNGFEEDGVTPKFDYVTVTSDISATNTNIGGASFVYYTESYGNPELVFSAIVSTVSGVSTQALYTIYNTSTNKINYFDNNSNAQDERSLPIAIVQRTGVISSLDQVFNSMGYIGSTVWVDKGVKGLIPNGRNEDGTLNNIEVTTSSVKTVGYAIAYKDYHLAITHTGNLDIYVSNSGGTLDRCEYKEAENINYNNYSKQQEVIVNVGKLSCDGTRITSFQPKQPFRAVDYNDAVVKSDKKEITGWSMPSNKIVKLTSGASGTVYTAPANGYIQCGAKNNNSNVAYLQISIQEPETYETLLVQQSWISYNATAGNTTRIFSPCQKGQLIYINYYNATINLLQFVYAEGDQ